MPAGDEIDRHPAFEQLNIHVGPGLLEQGLVNGFARGVCCVGNAPMGVATFLHEVKTTGAQWIGGEGHAFVF